MTKKRTSKTLSPGYLTLAEHREELKRLGLHEDMLENQRRRDEEVRQFQAELRKAEEPVVEDLRKVGIEVNRPWDLLSFERPYPEAFPILLEHLRKPHRGEVLEDLGRALAVPEARPLWPQLIELYKTATDKLAKDGLAIAISFFAKGDKRLLDDVIALVRDPNNGRSRLLMIDVLAASREPRAHAAMLDLRDDPDVHKEIAFRLKRAEYNARRRAKRQQLH